MMQVVHVLLATYNGERHLPEQWQSLAQQRGVELVLHVADDGSADGTPALIERLAARPEGALRAVRVLRAPPRRSATRSFLLLLREALAGDGQARWFAFCDQDDVWQADKLQAALAVLAAAPADRPALYGGRTQSIDDDGREMGLSPLFVRPPEFRNALVQSIMGGNTMLMNRAAAELVIAAADDEVTAHDWFAYQVVSGAGGLVHYDARPFVLYRQHRDNVVGSNQGWRARWRRLQRVLRGDYGQWNERHVRILQARAARLTDEGRRVLQAFAAARTASGPLRRWRWLRQSGVFRQPGLQQLSLYIACLLRRM